MSRAVRTWAAVLLAVGGCLAFSLELLARKAEQVRKAPAVDLITRADRRYDAVRDQLPPYGRVGYALKMRSPSLLNWYGQFGLVFAQYALAPRQVELDAGHEVVVEDFDDGPRLVRRPAR
jgi:hypothetical protein